MQLIKALFKFLVRSLAVIGLLVVLLIGLGIYAATTFEKPKLPQTIILSLDLRNKIEETENDSPLRFTSDGGAMPLRETIAAIDLAAKDDRVKLLIGRFRDDAEDYASAQEIRDAVLRYRSEDKMAFASATSFGEMGPADKAYYIASAFNDIWVQPVGMVGVTGPAAQMPFFKAALDKVGATAQFVHRREYKTVADSLTQTDFTPANAEMLGSILDDINSQTVDDIALARHIAPIDFFKLQDSAPLTANEALQAGVIDRIGYFDEIIDWALERLGDKAEVVDAQDYLDMRRAEMKHELEGKNTPTIAYIHGVGEISQGGGMIKGGQGGIDADEMAQALQDAVNDDEVEAVLIRLDSPGGSAVASETIRYAMQRVREAGLPLVVSMGGMAGSGAYWMATEADWIEADPATLTGSIGVVAGKIAGTEIWDKLGINWGMIMRGENADMWSLTTPFSDAQLARIDEIVGGTYDDFKTRVAAGRNMDAEQVEALAKGRVWTGAQAYELGLVDELGGFTDALAVSKNLIGLLDDERVMLKEFPEEEDMLERLKKTLARFGALGVSMQKVVSWLELAMPAIEPAVNSLAQKPGQVVMPVVRE